MPAISLKGHNHTCPDKCGKVPHVGGPITGGHDIVKVNGVPINRLTNIVLPIKPVGYAYSLSAYLQSKLGKATVLDQHINRPAYVDNDFGKALDKFFKKNPTVDRNPNNWGANHYMYEKTILDDYGKKRRGTKMSDRYDDLKEAFE